MCGTLGIIGNLNLGLARQALHLLSHRGQDASGIAWLDSETGHFEIRKHRGLPDKIPLEDPEKQTQIVVGSTRYPTFGSRGKGVTLDRFAQPFEAKSKERIVIAHNGNITNIPELSDKKYDSDAEFIADYLGELLDKSNGDLTIAVEEFHKSVDGSYAIAGIHRGKLFAFRDPMGIRPLAIGKNETLAIVASESYVHEFLGIMDWRDILPGELVILQKEDRYIEEKSKRLVNSKKRAHCMFEWVYFANPCSKIDSLGVYQARMNLGTNLAKQILENEKTPDYDYVIPVPDTSKIAAIAISETLGIPFREAIIKNRALLRTFIIPDSQERTAAATMKYQFIKDLINGKKLLVVDDSIVRGLTSQKIVKRLKELGAKRIGIAVTTPPQRYPCYYGIDFPKEEELIAHKRSISQIKEILGVSELYYQRTEDLEKSLSPLPLCTACITDQYPTPHAQKIRVLIKKGQLGSSSSPYEEAIVSGENK